MNAVFCHRCSTWRELFAPCACPRPRRAPTSTPSTFARVVSVAAALASDRMRRTGAPMGVTESEMHEARAVVASEVEA